MRLIDADKAIGHIKTRLLETALNNSTAVCDVAYVYQECADNRIETWVDEIPTVDAEPARHGRWEEVLPYTHHQPKEDMCSVCKVRVLRPTLKKWDYCPNCGARMDEVTE